jgi:hypothetical protein
MVAANIVAADDRASASVRGRARIPDHKFESKAVRLRKRPAKLNVFVAN